MQSRLLILCAQSALADQVAAMLEAYRPMVCADPEEAATLCREQGVHLVLVEEQLGTLSGADWFAALKETMPALAGILLGGAYLSELAPRALELGFGGLVVLPLAPERLLRQVERLLHSALAEQENIRLKTLLPLYRLAERFLVSQSEDEVLDYLIEAVSRELGVPSVSVMLYDEQDGALHVAAARGMDPEVARRVRVRPGERIAGWVYDRQEPVLLNRATQNFSPLAHMLQRGDISAALSVPLSLTDAPLDQSGPDPLVAFPLSGRNVRLGVLNVSETRSGVQFSQSDIELVGVLAGHGALALENVRTMREREDRLRLRTIFEQYVAPEVADVLLAHHRDLADVGTYGEMTVLFADIRHFTQLVQRLPLEPLHRLLNDFFHLLSESISAHKGTLDKFMGDAALAVFGAPIPLDSPNLAAIGAAEDILARFAVLRRDWLERYPVLTELGLGVGIGHGRMFFGNVGSSRRFDFTVLGAEVNIAERLASEAQAGEILLTETVARDLTGNCKLAGPQARVLRGMSAPVAVYRMS